MSSATSDRGLETQLLNVNRFAFLVVVGIVAVGLTVAGLPIFEISTLSQAIQPFLILVIGGYLGLTAVDLLWNRFY